MGVGRFHLYISQQEVVEEHTGLDDPVNQLQVLVAYKIYQESGRGIPP